MKRTITIHACMREKVSKCKGLNASTYDACKGCKFLLTQEV